MLRALPLMTGQVTAPGPQLTRSWEGGVTGWIVVCGAMLAELVAGLVTNHMPMVIAAPALVFPVAVAAGFAFVQWWQVRSSQAEPASWWHLSGVAAALLTWVLYPTMPRVFAQAGNAGKACIFLQPNVTPGCVQRATQAMDSRTLVWWLTGGLILGAALLTRRSRIAAWAAVPAAFGGCLLAFHFLELLNLYYHART
jgi:hypothetical protein